MLLWPDAENFPIGREIDFMEMVDHTRRTANFCPHYGPNNNQVHGQVRIDATQWHNWAVEWTPTHVAAFVDGREWFRTTNTSILPPGPMHLCIQLDWFPDGGKVQRSSMYVDWVRQYPLDVDGMVNGVIKDAARLLTNFGGSGVGAVVDRAGATGRGATDVAAPGVGRDLIRSLTEGRPDAVQPPGAVPADDRR